MQDSADTLSRLLHLYPVSTTLDIHCHFGAPWQLAEARRAAGTAPYHIMLSGGALLQSDGGKGIVLQAGDIAVLPHGSEHVLHAGSGEAVPAFTPTGPAHAILIRKENGADGPASDILCGQFHFDTLAAAALLPSLPAIMLVRTAGRPDFAGLQALMNMLRLETEQTRPGSHAVVTQLSSALFALLLRAWLEQDESQGQPGLFALLASPRLQRALHCMLSEPGRAWSLAQLAQACHLSRTTFTRLFREAAGATPGDVLTHTRMAQAARLLTERQQAVSTVADAVGYQSEASFHRAFKRHFLIGPGQYRRQHRAMPGTF